MHTLRALSQKAYKNYQVIHKFKSSEDKYEKHIAVLRLKLLRVITNITTTMEMIMALMILPMMTMTVRMMLRMMLMILVKMIIQTT